MRPFHWPHNPGSNGGLALTGLEARVTFADHEHFATTANDFAVAVPLLSGLQRGKHFHGGLRNKVDQIKYKLFRITDSVRHHKQTGAYIRWSGWAIGLVVGHPVFCFVFYALSVDDQEFAACVAPLFLSDHANLIF